MTATGPRFEAAPPAKLNLFLRVLAREESGYHGIETLFCRLQLADSLEAVRTADPGRVELEVEGPDLGPAEDNLALRAARMVLEATGRRFGVRLKLVKRIPVAAGLGGGSADAAAALDLVNRLAGNAVPRAELFHFASRLGADVPFLLSGAALGLAWGHGERLLALPPLPSAPVLLVVPPSGVSTAEAYRWVDEARNHGGHRGALALDLEAVSAWGHIARMAGNDFESAVFGRLPAVRAAFEALARTKPLVCRMTGSGSAIFAVYRNARDRGDARQMLGRKHGSVIETNTA
jgi:4-diphosphocytidyl-2-C-methyl-D-erythritol kinase